MKISASELALAVGGVLSGPDVTIDGPVVTDSREVSSGGLYVARVGEQLDGHDFISAAVEAGAVAAVVTKDGNWPCSTIKVSDATYALGQIAQTWIARLRRNGNLQVVGVTGSAGKTSTKDLLAQILSRVAPTVSNLRSFNNEVGMPLTALRALPQTRFLVLEMGADAPGNLRYLTDFVPLDVAVELMVGVAHLGGFGSREVLAKTKAELLDGLLPDGVAVLNRDDSAVVAMAQNRTMESIWFSALGSSAAQVRAEKVSLDESGKAHFDLIIGKESRRVALSLVGIHHVNNALAAAGAAKALGLSIDQISSGLCDSTAISPHRMCVFNSRGARIIDDSYNANPDSMRAGIKALAHLGPLKEQGKIKAIFGQMLELGEESSTLHRKIGEFALENGVEAAICVGEQARPLYETLQGQIEVTWCESAQEASTLVDGFILSGDTVLIKGSLGSQVYKIADELLQGVEDK
ncbi:UDP-N-acetylmuramoyl-tripeptide--D-alanyl-D-alanine ligase [Actinomycetaceae bacterium TAE3-ERU4]|nr:UDP-N-acetylmuramoyl-tripeptide--D-alanyl-D-alanine ligase [Actinomycetaceae bacterium TAE3-ERU4]